VTVDGSRPAPLALPAGPAQAGTAEPFGADADLAIEQAETARIDRIALSPRAHALIAAGLAVRAFALEHAADVRRTIALGAGRSLVFDGGIYGVDR